MTPAERVSDSLPCGQPTVSTIRAFVNTPFQAVCVAEFVHRELRVREGGSITIDLVIVGNARVDNVKSIECVARMFNLNYMTFNVTRFIPRIIRTLWYWLKCLRLLRACSPNYMLIVGNPAHDLFRGLLGCAETDEKWIVDDGAASAAMLGNFSGVGDPLRSLRGNHRVYYFLAEKLLGIKSPDWQQVQWYTIFQSEFRQLANVRPNHLTILSHDSQSKANSDEIWVLGQPIISAGVAEASRYQEWISAIVDYIRGASRGHKIIYIRHPAESRDPRREGAVYSLFDEVRTNEMPIETAVLLSDRQPKEVWSIMSTALVTLRTMMKGGTRFVFVRPDITEIARGKRAHILEMLSFLEQASKNRGIDTVRLVNLNQQQER